MEKVILSWSSWLKEYLFGTWDRAQTFVSSVLSLLSIVLTCFLWKFPDKIPELIIWRDQLVFFGLILILGVILTKYVRRETRLLHAITEIERGNRTLVEQFGTFHDQVHKYRDRIFRYYHSILKENLDVSSDEKNVFDKICHSLTTEVKKLFLNYFKTKGWDMTKDLTVSVKLTLPSTSIIDLYGDELEEATKKLLLQGDENKKWIVTGYRDPETYESNTGLREVGGRIYNPEANTAFHTIINMKKNFYFCNDLKSLGTNYNNENPNWQSCYNATAVIPIRYYDDKLNYYKYFGMLTVDSLNPCKYEFYNDQESRYILGHAADLLANYFLCLALSKSGAEVAR